MRRVLSLFLMMLALLCISDHIYAQGNIGRTPPVSRTTPVGGTTHVGHKPPKPRLTVNGESQGLSISFSDTGGEQTLTISTNQSTPKVESLPSWITVTEITKKQITLYCEENPSSSSRYDHFVVKAGKLFMQVNVSQPSAIPTITNIEFANMTSNGDTIDNYGSTLYASDMRFLQPRLTYNGPGSPKSKTLFVKIIPPNGRMMSNETSPSGYTYKTDVTFYPGIGNTVSPSGWGAKSGSIYNIGPYKIDVYCDGSRLYSGSIMLNRKSGESTYLKVNNQDEELSYNFGTNVSSNTFYVSSDCTGWRLSEVPSFCKVSNQTSTSFTLECDQNISRTPRSGCMFIKTDNQTVRMDIKQNAGTGAKINKVWVDHNVYKNDAKGMLIHVEFETSGLKEHQLDVCAFFYYKDGKKLEGYSGSGYCTVDGQTTVQKRTTSSYENSIWRDYELFIPNSKLSPNRPVELKFFIQIIDNTTGKCVATSEDFYFNLK